MVENLVVGTGPSATAAAMALRDCRCSFEGIDVGYDLDPAVAVRVDSLARRAPDQWTADERATMFPPARASAKGVEKRYAFGSDFPYRAPPWLELTAEDCIIDVSHGTGGFGNVWGAAVLPWVDRDLRDWPVTAEEMASSYRNVLRFVPVSSASDALEAEFPRFDGTGGALRVSEQMRPFVELLERRSDALRSRGIHAGRSRVAVDARGGDTTCRYCARCLDGCAYGAMFNPRNVWRRLEADGVRVRRGQYVVEVDERPDHVEVTALDATTGEPRTISARRVLLGAGAINSTRIAARSLRLTGRPIALKDSQYFFFPMLSYRRSPSQPDFTLAEAFVEVLDEATSPFYTHFQVYGLNGIFQQALRAVVPGPLRSGRMMRELEGRFYLFQGFLHSELSGGLELTLESVGPKQDRVRIRGVRNPASARAARRAQRLLRRAFIGFGVIPPVYLSMVPLGRSFHIGGSFPMGGGDATFSADRLGRPAGMKRVHLIDASTFPTIPANTITFSIMANADRVVRETVESAA